MGWAGVGVEVSLEEVVPEGSLEEAVPEPGWPCNLELTRLKGREAERSFSKSPLALSPE